MNNSMRVACKDGKQVVGFYEINSLPGCPQVAVSNHAFINPANRNQGYGKRFHGERLRNMQELGFDYSLCTVKKDNIFQKNILTRFNWRKLDEFTNRDTGNCVELWGKGLA